MAISAPRLLRGRDCYLRRVSGHVGGALVLTDPADQEDHPEQAVPSCISFIPVLHHHVDGWGVHELVCPLPLLLEPVRPNASFPKRDPHEELGNVPCPLLCL